MPSDAFLVGNDQISACGREPEISLGVQFTHSLEDQIAAIGHIERSLGQCRLFDGRLSSIFTGAGILQPGTDELAIPPINPQLHTHSPFSSPLPPPTPLSLHPT